MKPRFLAMIASTLSIYLAIHWFIGWNGWIFLSTAFHLEHSVWYWICFWFLAFSYLLARAGSRFLPGPLARFLKMIGSYWFAVMQFALLLLLIADIVALILYSASIRGSSVILILGSAVSLILLVLMIQGSWNAWNPIVRKYELAIAKPAGGMRQLRIAVASDLHLGTIVGNTHLQRLVDRVNALKPDLILLPGDVIDDDIEPFIREKMGNVMGKLQARYGIYAVPGNHEYYGGHIPAFIEEMKAIGIEVLMDRCVKLADCFYVIGRKDKTAEGVGQGGRMDLDALLSGVDKSLPLIMMDHQPHHLDKAAAAGIDVMLSGHTHRGQMAPNHRITRKLFELDWGYLKKNSMHAIVSSGFGTWGPPIRIGSRSEIIEVILSFEDRAI